MKLEDQVVSLELAKKLKELGVRQESAFYWRQEIIGSVLGDDKRWVLKDWTNGDFLSAFTVAELGEMLPGFFPHDRGEMRFHSAKTHGRGHWIAEYVANTPLRTSSFGAEYERYFQTADTEANARAKMLVYLIEQGIVKS
jgi:hypothetical protein